MDYGMYFEKTYKLGMVVALSALVSCGGSGGGGTSTPVSTYGQYQSANISATQFVQALNAVDGGYSSLELDTYETYRTQVAGEDEWFVIYDDVFAEHKSVSLDYVRTIVYYDYYSNSDTVPEEFREIESDDILFGELDGDTWGDDYEVVDYDYGTDSYFGRNSGFEYEDEEETLDTSLMGAEKEKMKFFKKASGISYTYNVSLSTSMALVTLGDKVEKMIGSNAGTITQEDQLALSGDLVKLTGVDLKDILKASTDEQTKADVLEKIAKKIGTSTTNLEDKVLPELFGINF